MLRKIKLKTNCMFHNLTKISTATIHILILILIFATRFIGIDSIPLPVNQDELVNIYDGYCIAETGKDHWGVPFPFITRALGEGDYRPSLQAYLCGLGVKIFGFSVWAGRLPMALLSIWGIWLLYLFIKRLYNANWGLFAASIAAISPWLFVHSHSAHEGAMLPAFFVILILYLFQKAQEDYSHKTNLILLGISIGLATSAYQSTRIIALIVSGAIFLDIILERKKIISNFTIPLFILFASVIIGALPQIWAFVFQFDAFVARGNILW